MIVNVTNTLALQEKCIFIFRRKKCSKNEFNSVVEFSPLEIAHDVQTSCCKAESLVACILHMCGGTVVRQPTGSGFKSLHRPTFQNCFQILVQIFFLIAKQRFFFDIISIITKHMISSIKVTIDSFLLVVAYALRNCGFCYLYWNSERPEMPETAISHSNSYFFSTTCLIFSTKVSIDRNILHEDYSIFKIKKIVSYIEIKINGRKQKFAKSATSSFSIQ